MAQRPAGYVVTSDSASDDSCETATPGGEAGHPWYSHSLHLHMREAHWRRPHYERRRMSVAFAIAALLHVILLLLLREQMRPRFPPEDRRNVLQVRILAAPTAETLEPVEPTPIRLIDENDDAAQPQVARVPAPSDQPSPRSAVPRSPASPARPPTSETTRTSTNVRLYGLDGRLLVDPQLATRAAAAGPRDFIAPSFVSPDMMRHRTPLPYEPTRFDEGWTPDHETLLGEFVRKSTKTYSTRTRWGGQFTCSWMLFLGGCSFGYAPPNPEGLKRMRENPPFKPHLAPPGTQPLPPQPQPTGENTLETG